MSRPSILPLAGAVLLMLAPIAAQAQGRATGLPEGAGKELVEGMCTACHETSQITRSSGYTSEDWQALTSTMVDLSGSPQERAQLCSIPRMPRPSDCRWMKGVEDKVEGVD